MKSILLATDYSKAASNGLQYAVALTKNSKAKLILFHVYDEPLPAADAPMVFPSAIKQYEEDNKRAIKILERKILAQTSGKIKVESHIAPGLPVDEIIRITKKKRVDLVVTGIPETSKVAKVFTGSTSTSLINKSRVPVLAVPVKSKFRKAKKIVLAYDYTKKINPHAVKAIRDFARLFKSQILVLNVVKLEEEPAYAKAKAMVSIKNALKGIKYRLFFSYSENIVDEINLFIRKHKASLLIMLPHKHPLMERFLYPSNTKSMVFQTDIPLLSLHA